MVKIIRNEKNTNTKKRRILELLSPPVRYIMSKVKSIYKKLMKREPKKTLLKY